MGTFGFPSLWGGSGGGGTTTPPVGVPVKPLFYAALRLAHVTRVAQVTPSPDQLADTLQQAQLMFDQASVRRPMVFGMRISTYLLGGAKINTIGTGGTLVDQTTNESNRPIAIERAKLILPGGTPVHLEIFKGTFAEFADITVQDIPAAIPRFLYCDYNAPVSNIYLVPQDRGGDLLELYDWQPQPSLVSVDDLIVLPPGYSDWFVNVLAVRLASVFAEQGAYVTDDTRAEATRATKAIQTRNINSPRMRSDASTSSRRGDFNYYSGTR